LAAAVAGTAGCGTLQPDTGNLEGYRTAAFFVDSPGVFGGILSDIEIDEIFTNGSPVE
jgi:hypothetical protein